MREKLKADFKKLLVVVGTCKTIAHLNSSKQLFENLKTKWIRKSILTRNTDNAEQIERDLFYVKGYFDSTYYDKKRKIEKELLTN